MIPPKDVSGYVGGSIKPITRRNPILPNHPDAFVRVLEDTGTQTCKSVHIYIYVLQGVLEFVLTKMWNPN